MKGNEAIAHAAIRYGVDGYFGYPITPQSEILETLMAENNGNGRWLSPEEAVAAGLADVVTDAAVYFWRTLRCPSQSWMVVGTGML